MELANLSGVLPLEGMSLENMSDMVILGSLEGLDGLYAGSLAYERAAVQYETALGTNEKLGFFVVHFLFLQTYLLLDHLLS